ncbi:hypothetical protein RQP46_003413 [Phenoliferia psychrophenolica]
MLNRTLRTLVPLTRQLPLVPRLPSAFPRHSPSLLLSRSLASTPFRSSLPPVLSTTPESSPSPSTAPELAETEEVSAPPKRHAIGQIKRRLQITFTCTAPVETSPDSDETVPCSHRSTHEFSKRSYDHGIVLIECPGCKNRHLIADNLSWFSSTPSPGFPEGLPIGGKQPSRTVEDLVKEKGEEVKWLDGGKEGATWTIEG